MLIRLEIPAQERRSYLPIKVTSFITTSVLSVTESPSLRKTVLDHRVDDPGDPSIVFKRLILLFENAEYTLYWESEDDSDELKVDKVNVMHNFPVP